MPGLRAILLVLLALASAAPLTTGAQARPPARRQPVTPALERTAFADEDARTLLARARAARIAQDAALTAYDARSWIRLSLGIGLRRFGPERLLGRYEQAARVQWSRTAGAWIEPTGRRAGVPLGGADVDLLDATPIPYFPGREALWIPGGDGTVRAEVNENDLLHPLAEGAEAYYRYATGDSAAIRLPGGETVRLRELRVTPRRVEWRAFVGSFWFDAARGNLVRAAYRLASDIDLFAAGSDQQRRLEETLAERLRTDTGEAAARTRRQLDSLKLSRGDRAAIAVARGVFTPLRVRVRAITVEYGLFEGRFWLPRSQVAEGEYQASIARLPMTWEERFRYDRVNGDLSLPPVAPGALGLAAGDTTWAGIGAINIGGAAAPRDTSAAADSARAARTLARYTASADSARARAAALRAKGDTAGAARLEREAERSALVARRLARRQAACTGAAGESGGAARDSSYVAGTISRFDGALRVAVRLPCDEDRLAQSPDLPGSVYDPNEALFGGADRDALLKALDLALQPAWGPQRPSVRTGLDLVRYNRIEGLSAGVAATSSLGLGFTAEALARFGLADRTPNGELAVARGDGRRELRLAAFRRLGVVNDDWGAPLSFGASVNNLLLARDEGFYFRTWGAELAGTRALDGAVGAATLRWRLFGERQTSAGIAPNTQASLRRLLRRGDDATRFVDNVAADALTALGAGAELARTFGVDPAGTRLDLRARGEGAYTARADSLGRTGYARLMLEGTAARPLPGPFTLAVTGAAGSSLGTLPAQRAFLVGGLQTVRGQFARPVGAGRVGDAFWLARTELGFGPAAARLAPFYDLGWAGARGELFRAGRPLAGAGVGLSLLDGLARVDVARGVWPERRWRVDLSLGARF